MKGFRTWIRIIIRMLLSLIGILLILTIVVNVFFKDQLIHYVINQLNTQVDARINIQKIDFTLWQRFPNASVRLDKVLAQSANPFKAQYQKKGQQDTLLNAEEIYVEFNLFHLFSGDYQIKNILIRNGHLNLILTDEGVSNFNILRKRSERSNSSVSIELKSLILKNISLRYKDLNSLIDFACFMDETRVSGTLGKVIQCSVRSNLFLQHLTIKSENYVNQLPMKLRTELSIQDSLISFRDSRFSLRQMSFLMNGKFSTGEDGQLDLMFEGDHLNLSQLLEASPGMIRSKIEDFSGKGSVNFRMKLSGTSKNLKIGTEFSLENGQITQKANGMKLKEIFLQGTFRSESNNLRSFTLFHLNRFSAELGSGSISANGSLSGIAGEQKFQINGSYKLNLNDLKEFINKEKVELLSGKIAGKINSSGILPDGFNFSAVKDLNYKGDANLSEVKIKMKNSEYLFENMNGVITLDNAVSFQNIFIMVHDNDFLLNGSLTGVLPYFLKQRSDVTLKAEVFSNHLDLSKYFITTDSSSRRTQEYSRELLFPENMIFDVSVKINNFKLNRFTARNISGTINYKPKIFVLKSLIFSSLSGRVSGNGVIIQDVYKNFMVQGQTNVTQLDIQQMFYSFHNFSQNVLQDKHLRGMVSGQISFSSEWNNALTLNQDKLLVDADLTIKNGQLLNFEPLEGLSRFCSIDELRNVKFSTLKNQFLIKDKQIIIPQMSIESSAFGISASGIHTFDNHYEYKLKVSLSELLWHKSKHSKQNDFGEIEEDGLGKFNIPFSITGYCSDYKIKPAPKLLVNDIKDSFKKQKGELKTILKEEFGWFKRDTTGSSSHTNAKPKTHISWEDSDQSATKEVKTRTKSEPVHQIEKPRIEWE